MMMRQPHCGLKELEELKLLDTHSPHDQVIYIDYKVTKRSSI